MTEAPVASDDSLPHLFLLRLSGEVGTKARATRTQFARRLRRNLRDALRRAGIEGRVERRYERIFVAAARPEAEAVLRRVFGLQSLSRVEKRPGGSLEEVVRCGVPLFREAVRGRRFAVRARHVGQRGCSPFPAREVEVRLGASLLPEAAGVDLDRPEATVHVELYRGAAYFFHERIPGPGGLPLGTAGRALALVSGGFDSPVAAWLMLKRGVALDHVFCNLGGRAHQLGALRVMKVLADRWSYGTRPRLHGVDFGGVAAQLRERTEPRYWQVLLKREMLRAAQLVARGGPAAAIVTGEAVGQVSSQTLPNLAVISEATSLPILRPLVGFNKDEIIARAREIGTEALSAVVQEYCAMLPRRPATAASLDAVREQESRLDPAVLERAVAERAVFDLVSLDPEAGGLPELEVESLPADATLIDLRSRAAFRAWQVPGALQLGFAEALRAYASFDKTKRYVLVCEFGLKSAHLAELMRKAGLEAFHVRGGIQTLMRDAGTPLELLAPVTPGD